MRDSELRELLRRAGEDVPEPDVAEATWSRGRVARRHRWTARVVGGLAAAAVVGGLGVQLASWPGGGVPVAGGVDDASTHRFEPPPAALGGPPASPELVAAEEVRRHAQEAKEAKEAKEAQESRGAAGGDDRASEGGQVIRDDMNALAGATLLRQARQTWADVYTGCLESRGYTVSRDGVALSVELPEGAIDGDYRRVAQACRAELATDAPVSVPPREGIDRQARAALTERYFEYYWAQSCLVDAGLPTVPTMLAEEFVTGLAWAQLPPWHPYEEAARQGRYAEAREACPIQVTS